jgi:hypothetical protein
LKGRFKKRIQPVDAIQVGLQRLQQIHELTLSSLDSQGLDDRNVASTTASAFHPKSQQPLLSRRCKQAM